MSPGYKHHMLHLLYEKNHMQNFCQFSVFLKYLHQPVLSLTQRPRFGSKAGISTISLASEGEANAVFWDGRHYYPVGSDIKLLCQSAVENTKTIVPVLGSCCSQLSDRL